uniref:PPM-type phosphatase domain-containing protein n=1 Tax=Cucumis sativus TaxID=3659 RepID=A0A0A0K7Z8_CUCSA
MASPYVLYFKLDGKMMGWWRKIFSWFIILAGLMGTEVFGLVLLSACQIIFANCGDSSIALLWESNQPLTADHKISWLDEYLYDRLVREKREFCLLAALGSKGGLAMTRAIGDH